MMRVIYIAGPFRSKSKPYNYYEQHMHIVAAEAAALAVWQRGGVALCPHLNTQNFQGAAPDELWLEGDLELMRRCDAVFATPGYETSSGAVVEVKEALRMGIPVLYSIEEVGRFLNPRWPECESCGKY